SRLGHVSVVRLRTIADLLGIEQARFQGRCDQRFEIAAAEVGIGILAGDDFALLGDAQSAGDAAGGLSQDRLVAWAAAASHRSSSAMKQAQLDARVAKRADQR